jgi:hypothetical protein
MSKRDIKFNIGKREYLFPREQGLTYPQMEELMNRANRENPPKRGIWDVGIPEIYDAKLLAELHDLGVLPPRFYDYPVVSGAFFNTWINDERKMKGNSYVGWLKPIRDEMWSWVTSVEPDQGHGVFLTNWRTSENL